MKKMLSTLQGRFSRATINLAGIAALSIVIAPFCARIQPSVPGLPSPQRKIHIKEVQQEEFLERFQVASREAITDLVRCQRLGLYDLGLVSVIEPNLQPKLPGFLELALGAPVSPAFYVAGSDTIFTLFKEDPTIAHEWVHAVDDQVGTRLQGIALATTTDERIALRAAVEGTAVMATDGEPPLLPLGGDLDENMWAFAYSIGPRYVRSYSSGSVTQALALSPATTHEVIFHFSPPLAQLPEPLSTPERSLLCSDRLGVAGLIAALHRSGANADDMLFIARAWRGDRLDIYSTKKGRELVWNIAFADAFARDLWNAGPGLQTHLTSPFLQIHAVLTDEAQLPSILDSLGK